MYWRICCDDGGIRISYELHSYILGAIAWNETVHMLHRRTEQGQEIARVHRTTGTGRRDCAVPCRYEALHW
jgi:hypothetical protein